MAQADTIIPPGVQGLDRYAYANNSPLNFVDPSGHWPLCEAGYRCTVPIADTRDVTQWLVVAAVDIAKSEEIQSIKSANQNIDKVTAFKEFISIVEDGAKYDVKDKMKDLFKEDPIKIGEGWYEYSTAGNIIYGFYGKEAGFTDFELHAGAGYAQGYDYFVNQEGELGWPGWPYYGDTADDYYAIEFGIFLYNEYYSNDGSLTQNDLLDAFEKFEYAERMHLETKPKNFIPRYYDYPADRFYK